MRVQDSHSRKSLPSQQLLTTPVSLREKKKRCLMPSECVHFRRDCQKAQSLKELLRVIMAALKLQISNDDIQPGMFTSHPLMGAHQRLLVSQALSWG